MAINALFCCSMMLNNFHIAPLTIRMGTTIKPNDLITSNDMGSTGDNAIDFLYYILYHIFIIKSLGDR